MFLNERKNRVAGHSVVRSDLQEANLWMTRSVMGKHHIQVDGQL